jgi:YgiT-type zinc finger domain-containing protein
MYGYKCEYCDGIVQERVVEREAFKHRLGFVILENVPIGVCNKCGYRYYHSSLLHRVEEIARLLSGRNRRSEWNWFLSLLLRES